jgi:glycosyltransferase involved in cell wall biosynthesis
MEGRLFLAVPVMNEGAFLPATLHSLTRQTLPPTRVYICVNQPDAWHEGTPAQRAVCRDNGETLAWLRSFRELPLTVLDRSTPGKGWQGKRSGAGWARKVLMDAIDADARDEDILVSMDGDTFYKPGYLEAVCDSLGAHPRATALSAPFYHPLGPVEEQNRALLRYELYMRHYFLNLLRIDSPYAFLALGSTISLPVWAYRKVGGISPFKAGEDFYFLQKLAKVGRGLNPSESVVYPAARRAGRGVVGTGPAIL